VVALDLTALAGMTRAAEVFDVPYSGPQLKTLKYHPTFPERFGSVQDARAFCQGFFPWYNSEHRHDGLGLFTPETVHYGHVDGIPEQRRTVH
jgi:putative transposase